MFFWFLLVLLAKTTTYFRNFQTPLLCFGRVTMTTESTA